MMAALLGILSLSRIKYTQFKPDSILSLTILSIKVSPSFGGTGIFSLGSRFRYSGHTQKEALQQVQNTQRQPPQVKDIAKIYITYNIIYNVLYIIFVKH